MQHRSPLRLLQNWCLCRFLSYHQDSKRGNGILLAKQNPYAAIRIGEMLLIPYCCQSQSCRRCLRFEPALP
ncbi:hypothetical protein I656_03206 [Geobacillus sp. WSUCF1]|nr:hypothetical protein I656_03206 [Geobacillus sp. WSUCF1]